MISWEEFKKGPSTLSESKINLIDTLSFLQAKRIKQYISQKELVERIGMSQFQIARLENMDVFPTTESLMKYAKGLGFNLIKGITSWKNTSH